MPGGAARSGTPQRTQASATSGVGRPPKSSTMVPNPALPSTARTVPIQVRADQDRAPQVLLVTADRTQGQNPSSERPAVPARWTVLKAGTNARHGERMASPQSSEDRPVTVSAGRSGRGSRTARGT